MPPEAENQDADANADVNVDANADAKADTKAKTAATGDTNADANANADTKAKTEAAANADAGKGGDDFLSSLDEEHRVTAEAKGWKTPNDAVKAYNGIRKLVGEGKPTDDIVALPKPNEIKDWEHWDKLGVPETVEGYEIKQPELAEGVEWDTDQETALKAYALENKWPAHITQQAVDMYAGIINLQAQDMAATATAQKAEMMSSLDKDWGDQKDRNVEISQRAAKELGVSEATLAELNATEGSAGLIKLFHQIGEAMLTEDDVLLGTGGPGGGAMTPERARAQMKANEADADFTAKLMDKTHTGHKEAVEEQARLRKIANPASN